MAIERRREGRPLPEENGSVPGAAAAPPGPPPGAGLGVGAEIQAVPPPPSSSSAACSPLLLDYDGSVLPFLGGLGGGYQRTLVLLTWVPALFIGFSKFSDSFLLDQPDFWCRQADGQQGDWNGSLVPPGHANRSGIFPTATALPGPGNASECDCHEWHYRIRAGLVQNVVSKVRRGAARGMLAPLGLPPLGEALRVGAASQGGLPSGPCAYSQAAFGQRWGWRWWRKFC